MKQIILDKIEIKFEFWRTLPISVIASIFMYLTETWTSHV